MKNLFVLWAAAALLISGLVALSPGVAMATEEPRFTLVLHDGAFEVRDYPTLVVAETTVTGSRERAASSAFERLAGYIFGGNTPRGATASETAPTRGERFAMTAPVTQSPVSANNWVVQFFMPDGSRLAAMPTPRDPSVRLREEPARRVAVLRFSGAPNADDLQRRSAELLGMVQARGLRTNGAAPIYAFYDPPWTLAFLRRNEVMVVLEPA
jgi:hypothetical protein